MNSDFTGKHVLRFSVVFLAPYSIANAVVTCDIKLFPNYFSLDARPSEINFSARRNFLEIISKLFHRLIAAHEYFLHVHCRLKISK